MDYLLGGLARRRHIKKKTKFRHGVSIHCTSRTFTKIIDYKDQINENRLQFVFSVAQSQSVVVQRRMSLYVSCIVRLVYFDKIVAKYERGWDCGWRQLLRNEATSATFTLREICNLLWTVDFCTCLYARLRVPVRFVESDFECNWHIWCCYISISIINIINKKLNVME